MVAMTAGDELELVVVGVGVDGGVSCEMLIVAWPTVGFVERLVRGTAETGDTVIADGVVVAEVWSLRSVGDDLIGDVLVAVEVFGFIEKLVQKTVETDCPAAEAMGVVCDVS